VQFAVPESGPIKYARRVGASVSTPGLDPSSEGRFGWLSPIWAMCIIVVALGVGLLLLPGGPIPLAFLIELIAVVVIALPFVTFVISTGTVPRQLVPAEESLTIVYARRSTVVSWGAVRLPPSRYGPFGAWLPAQIGASRPGRDRAWLIVPINRRQYDELSAWLRNHRARESSS
jgi:hypothetical protein